MPDLIYLDNAATSLRKPPAVAAAVSNAITSAGNSGRGVHEAALHAARIVYETRCRMSKLIHAEDPSRIAFTMNVTESLNMALFGILDKGDHLITTCIEHNSVLRPVYMLEKQGVEVTILPCDSLGNVDSEAFEKAIKENTKAIVCTHGSNLTGNLMDIKAIGAIAARHDLWFIVDAAQTAGVFDIDVRDMNIDVLCFTGHKSLMGPQGTGGLYVKTGRHIRPLLMGGTGVQTYLKEQPPEMPTALEAGTLNVHGLAGLGASLAYLEEYGIGRIREKELALMWAFYDFVVDTEGVTIYGDFTKRDRCPIVSLNIRDYDSALVADELYTEYGIAVRPGAHCAPLLHQALGTAEQGAVRFSFSHFNTLEEVTAAAEAVRTIAGNP